MKKNVVIGNKPLVYYIQYVISACNGHDVLLKSRGRNIPTACWLAIALSREQNFEMGKIDLYGQNHVAILEIEMKKMNKSDKYEDR